MVELEGQIKQWGNSIAFRVRKREALAKGLRLNQRARILIIPEGNAAARTFGILKGKLRKSGQQLKDEIRKELHGM